MTHPVKSLLVGISGLAGSGKDTVANLLGKHHGFVSVSLADPMKRILQDLFAFSEDQLWGPSEQRNVPDRRYRRPRSNVRPCDHDYLTPRHALQQLGTEFGRACYQDVWVEYAVRVHWSLQQGSCYYDKVSGLRFCASVQGVMVPKTHVVIPDVRFHNELAALKKAGAKMLRIVRPGAGLTGPEGFHTSETEQQGIEDSQFDHIIDNSGSLDDLKTTVDQIMATWSTTKEES